MSDVQEVFREFTQLPVEHVIALIALSAIGVAAYAIFAMLSVTTRGRK
ncbi:hypothetical protein [Reyranella sp.]